MTKNQRVVIEFWSRPEQRAEAPVLGAVCAAFMEADGEIRELRERVERAERLMRKMAAKVRANETHAD